MQCSVDVQSQHCRPCNPFLVCGVADALALWQTHRRPKYCSIEEYMDWHDAQYGTGNADLEDLYPALSKATTLALKESAQVEAKTQLWTRRRRGATRFQQLKKGVSKAVKTVKKVAKKAVKGVVNGAKGLAKFESRVQ